ncbi:hypothetical protein EDD85DRAFT_956420 [Armillaria nabsnona]|nr:hypothetical protein EDD85DRAFT_956420 [Armillaria nabsnona]
MPELPKGINPDNLAALITELFICLMTPDLTTEQTIAIGTAIVGIVLVFFTTALIFLTYGERIRQRLYQLGLLAPIVQIPNTNF